MGDSQKTSVKNPRRKRQQSGLGKPSDSDKESGMVKEQERATDSDVDEESEEPSGRQKALSCCKTLAIFVLIILVVYGMLAYIITIESKKNGGNLAISKCLNRQTILSTLFRTNPITRSGWFWRRQGSDQMWSGELHASRWRLRRGNQY